MGDAPERSGVRSALMAADGVNQLLDLIPAPRRWEAGQILAELLTNARELRRQDQHDDLCDYVTGAGGPEPSFHGMPGDTPRDRIPVAVPTLDDPDATEPGIVGRDGTKL